MLEFQYDEKFNSQDFLRFRHSLGLFARMAHGLEIEGLYQQVADAFVAGDIDTLKHLCAQGAWGFREYGLLPMEAAFLKGIAGSALAILRVPQDEIDQWENFAPSKRPKTSVRANKQYKSSANMPPLSDMKEQSDRHFNELRRSTVHGDVDQRRSKLRELFGQFKDANTKAARMRIGREFDSIVGDDIEIVDDVLGPMGLEMSKLYRRAMASKNKGNNSLTADEQAAIELFGYLRPR